MKPCATCGNVYDKAFTITTHDGTTHTFDSFECAIHKVAPVCAHCRCHIIGHGVESDSGIFCCVHCARHNGAAEDLKDRT